MLAAIRNSNNKQHDLRSRRRSRATGSIRSVSEGKSSLRPSLSPPFFLSFSHAAIILHSQPPIRLLAGSFFPTCCYQSLVLFLHIKIIANDESRSLHSSTSTFIPFVGFNYTSTHRLPNTDSPTRFSSIQERPRHPRQRSPTR